MKSKIVLATLFTSLLMSCESDLKTVGVYDGKQTLDFTFTVEAPDVLEGMTTPEVMRPAVYKVCLFSDNVYTQTLTFNGNGNLEVPAGNYTYLCLGAESNEKLPQIALKEGETKMADAFLKLTDEDGNMTGEIPSIVAATGNFTMGSTINTVPVALKPIGCEYTFNLLHPAARMSTTGDIVKVKAVIKGGASVYGYNLHPSGEAGELETVMKGTDTDGEGWVSVDGDATTFSARVLLPANPSLQLKLFAKDESGNETEIGETGIELSGEGASYIADIAFSGDSEGMELQYHSPYYPTVIATDTGEFNEHELKVTSTVYPEYTYQWRHERAGRTTLLGLSNNKLKYMEDGIEEGASVTVTGAGKYILSVGKDGVSKDVATLTVKHARMTWDEAKAKVRELGSGLWTLPNREQMKELYNNDINDFYYDEVTEKASAVSYWTSEESGTSWAYVYFFDPYWENAPTWAPEKSTMRSVRLLKILPFEYDPTDPFSVGLMAAPAPYAGEQELTITTPVYEGATYQWSHKVMGRKVMQVSADGKVSYVDDGIPEGATVKVSGAGEYILNVTYGEETREIGRITLLHKNLCWTDVESTLAELNEGGNGTWAVPGLEQLRSAYNNGKNDFSAGWYWAKEFTNAANRWRYLKDMGSGVEDGGDVSDSSRKYNIRFCKVTQ